MQNSALPFRKPESALDVAELRRYTEGWLLACDIARHSPQTLSLRRHITGKLLWFLADREIAFCGLHELRLFFAYLNHGHEEPRGRWGNPLENQPVKPGTVATYDRHLRTFFTWLVREEVLPTSPMDRITEPVDRPDQIEPFTDEEVEALLAAAKKSNYSRRDEAIIWFLLDTGIRASELCGLAMSDMDLTARRCKIREGKGGKARLIWFGAAAAKALWNYLKFEPHEEHDPLFFNKCGEAFTRSGLLQLMGRMGNVAKIKQTRCSPHTFRHTFAISFLRAGGDVLTLQQLLGHTSLAMVNRYVKLAQTDLAQAHRQFSPGDRLRGKRQSKGHVR
jgi:site-specific recombinase XerD